VRRCEAGDVILKVDDKDIQNADDFTWWLEQAGPSSSVEFTVARPDSPAEAPLNVKLSGKFDPNPNFNEWSRFPAPKGFSLIEQGIETIALQPFVASQLGTTAGLLVVYVDPVTAAFDAGLQAGDVIQSINDKPVTSFNFATQPDSFTFAVVRNKEKLVVKSSEKPVATKRHKKNLAFRVPA
jgi:S1-C subfamily serine protease